MGRISTKTIDAGCFMRIFIGLLISIGALALCTCSDVLLDEQGRALTEANRPSLSPGDGTIITAHEIITFTFPKTMDPASVTVSGDIGTAELSWKTNATSNDTLVLNDYSVTGTPKIVWSAGTGRSLIVTVIAAGETIPYTYLFDVFRGVCVKEVGDDGERGTAGSPLATIQAGIAKAVSLYGSPSEVHVAGGDYTVPAAAANGIVMEGGISLLGGYAAQWQSRDWVANSTIITDLRSLSDAAVSFLENKGIATSTVFEGFTVYASSSAVAASTTSAVKIRSSSPTIRNNVLIAGGDANGVNRYGISIESAAVSTPSPIISGNTINSPTQGGGSLTSNCIGIYISADSSPIIRDNVVYAGRASATGDACAALYIATDNSLNPITIERNTLYGGSGGAVGFISNAVVYIIFSTVEIDLRNNLVVSSAVYTGNRCCIYYPSDSGSCTIRNNTIAFSSANTTYQSYGIQLDFPSSTVNIDNNIFLYIATSNGTPSNAFCIYENQALTPVSVNNNDFYGLNTAGDPIVVYRDSGGSLLSVAQLNSGAPVNNNGSGNVSSNPILDAITYRPGSSMLPDVKTGGINGSTALWGFVDDREGKVRTGAGATGWTMGCYELD